MTVEYLDLVDFLAIAADVTGLDAVMVTKVSNLHLADSALHAPAASFGEVDLYPDFVDKAAVLLIGLAKNHPLPDGNKRAAWFAMRMFVAINGWRWRTSPTAMQRPRWCSLSPLAKSARHAPPSGCVSSSRILRGRDGRGRCHAPHCEH